MNDERMNTVFPIDFFLNIKGQGHLQIQDCVGTACFGSPFHQINSGYAIKKLKSIVFVGPCFRTTLAHKNCEKG